MSKQVNTTNAAATPRSLVKVTYKSTDRSEEYTGDFIDFAGREDYTQRISGKAVILSVEAITPTNQQAAEDVAALLPGTWTIEPAFDNKDTPYKLTRADGLPLWFSPFGAYSRKAKGNASYNRPRDRKAQYVDVYPPTGGDRINDPSINYSLTKTPEQVAKDIARRLIPEAEKLHALVLDRIKQADEYHDREEVAEATAQTLKSSHNIYFRSNGASIRVEGYTTPEVARAIADFLATIPESK